MTGPAPQPPRGGLPYALGAHLVWGLLPLYLMLVREVPAIEFVAWRVLFTLPFCLLFIVALRQGAQLRAALTDWRVLRLLVLSGLLIGGAVGAVLGHEAAGRRGDRTVGALLGGTVGALLGREIDRSDSRCR